MDFYHKDFRNADGTTRIVTMWDQTIPGNPPEGFKVPSNSGTISLPLSLLCASCLLSAGSASIKLLSSCETASVSISCSPSSARIAALISSALYTGGYAVIRIPQYQIARLSDFPQIDYIEKPKSLLLESMEGIGSSCVSRVSRLPV